MKDKKIKQVLAKGGVPVGWGRIRGTGEKNKYSVSNLYVCIKIEQWAEHWWLRPVVLAAQEAKIRRIMVWRLHGQIVLQEHISKDFTKIGLVVTQGEGSEFKTQYHTQKKRLNSETCWNCSKKWQRGRWRRMIEGVNLIKLYCKHICI
jgi:hypothetical protein